jgi:DNA-binding transcriptional ArsR family regulator
VQTHLALLVTKWLPIFVDVFGALADPVRRSLLGELAAGPSRVADLAADRPISRPAVSKHLRLLSEAGLVTAADHGRERHYVLRPDGLIPVRAFLSELLASERRPVPELAAALDALDTEVRRTARQRRTRHSETSIAEHTHEETA